MIFLLCCLITLLIQYLLIKLTIKKIKSESIKTHIITGAIIGLLLGVPLWIVVVPYTAFQLENLLFAALGPESFYAASGPAIGRASFLSPVKAISDLTGLRDLLDICYIVGAIGWLSGLYLSLIHFFRRNSTQGILYSTCSLTLLCLPLLLVAPILLLQAP